MKSWASRDMGAKRSDGTIVRSFPNYRGVAHTWLVFVSDRGKASDSVYTRMLTPE